jgi:imidazolonepropionase-like amidohydrolase
MAIVNVTAIPMDTERTLPVQTVVIESGRITRLAPSAHVDVTGMQVVDGTGKFLLPGLADMHVHLGDPADSVLARDAGECLLYLAHGVTAVRNMWGHPFHLALRQQVDAGELPGPRIVSTSPLTDGPNPGGKPLAYRSAVIDEPAAAGPLVAAYRRRGYDQLKVYGQLTLPVLESLGQAAAREGLPMTGHCPDYITYDEAADAGMVCFEHLHNIYNGTLREGASAQDPYDANPERVAHIAANLDWDALRRLADRFAAEQVWNCPTLVVGLDTPVIRDLGEDPLGAYAAYIGLLSPLTATIRRNHPIMVMPLAAGPVEMREARRQKDELKLGITRLLHEQGAPLLIGTDAPLVVPGQSLHDELRAFVRAGLTPYQALRCATTEPVRFLRWEADLGTIAEGKRADLVLLNANPLSDVAAAADIAAILVNGYYLEKKTCDTLLAERAAAVAACLPAPALPAAPDGATCLSRGTFVERRFGAETGVLAYAHYRRPDGGWVIHEADRSHTRDRTTRLHLRPDRMLQHAEVSGTFPIGDEKVEIAWKPDDGYHVILHDVDGGQTTTAFGEALLAASDTLARTAPLAYRFGGNGASIAAIAADDEAIEEHTFTPASPAADSPERWQVDADHPREPMITYTFVLGDAGDLRSITRASFIGSIGNEVVWEPADGRA